MPPRDVRLLLQDIVDACDLIMQCTPPDGRDSYLADPIRRSSVERQFEIIGEAMKRLLDATPGLSFQLPEAREVIQFRNFISHGYHLIDHGVVWTIAQTDVPALRRRATLILSDTAQG
ncbi:MAG: DUF86 domain-containing protein [Phycisphaerales bacterium]|nr:DUF86 domain-containing protein [Phycisphaerales bacterium]